MKDLNVENIVRSAAVVAVGLPLVLSLNNLVNVTARLAEKSGEDNAIELTTELYKGQLTGPCIKYVTSKVDSKLERTAKNEIDEVLGGDVEHRATCNWVLGMGG